jgi:hypothetical protein
VQREDGREVLWGNRWCLGVWLEVSMGEMTVQRILVAYLITISRNASLTTRGLVAGGVLFKLSWSPTYKVRSKIAVVAI